MVGKTSDKSYNKKVSFSFSHLGFFGEGAWLCFPLRSIAVERESENKKRARESSEGARFYAWLLIPVLTRITPTGVKAIIKTSNEFYVCACPPLFQNPNVSVFSRVSPGCCMESFFFSLNWPFSRVETSAIDRRHPGRAQFRANLVVKRKKNLTNSISSHQTKMFNKNKQKMHCFFVLDAVVGK